MVSMVAMVSVVASMYRKCQPLPNRWLTYAFTVLFTVRLAFIWLTLHFRSVHPNQSSVVSHVSVRLLIQTSTLISFRDFCLNKCPKHFVRTLFIKHYVRNEALIWRNFHLIYCRNIFIGFRVNWRQNWTSNAIKRWHKPKNLSEPESHWTEAWLHMKQTWIKIWIKFKSEKRSTLSKRNEIIIYLKDWWMHSNIDRF